MSFAAWETWKLAHAYPQIGSGTTPMSNDASYYGDENNTPWITTAELRENYILKTASNVTDKAIAAFPALRVYEPGSLFIAMYGATIGRLGINQVAASCNQACGVFEKSNQFNNRYLFYWLWHRRPDLIALSVGGGQPNLSQHDLRQERALRPPLEVQRRIVNFLDEKTERIDALIEKKRALLERLQEKRQALITQAITKGLDPDAPMKDSGIDWLGQIPAHWEVKRLKYVASFNDEVIPENTDEHAELNYVEISGVSLVDGITSTANIYFFEAPSRARRRVKSGDILISTVRTYLKAIAAVQQATENLIASTGFCVVRPHADVVSDYLGWTIKSEPFVSEIVARSVGVSYPAIKPGELLSLGSPVPPSEEQHSIAEFLSDKTSTIDSTSKRVKVSIEQLVEYRAALIIVAVTGQLEVAADAVGDRPEEAAGDKLSAEVIP